MRLRPAWTSYWPWGLAALGVLLLWGVQREAFDGIAAALGLPSGLSAAGLVVGLGPIAIGVLYRQYTRLYEVEGGQRLRVTRGFVSRVRREFALSDQVQVDLTQSAVGRLLNYGTVTFWTGDDRSGLAWANVPDPAGVVDSIHALRSPTANGGDQGSSLVNGGRERPSLKLAKKARRTDFGGERSPTPVLPRDAIETPFGHYVDNGDGTILHRETGLRIIRAPWGMVWDGAHFNGEPIQIDWGDAVRLFGRGADVTYGVGGAMALFSTEKRQASAFHNGYKHGRCKVDFAGFQDWRLPTADELERMSASAGIHAPSELSRDEQLAWRWKGKANTPVIERLYPEWSANMVNLWSATGLGGGLAWAFDGSFPVGDMKTKVPMGVMFVRQGDRA